MDVLDYDYDSGNKLLKVADTGNKAHGFKDGTNTNDDFEYDINGNLKIDRNKGITSITYNHLNLPDQVDFGSDNIKYVYDAAGTKLKKTVSTGTATEYSSGYVYENNTLQFFPHAEGYVMPDGNGWRYVYQYRDHLNNIRLSYTEDPNGGLEIVEDNTYYPFGLKMRGFNGNVSPLGNNVAQKWKYNGKELDEDFGLNWYHYGFRMYDAAIGRFPSIDPISDQFPHVSTYNYAENEPIGSIDLHGLQRVKVNGKIFDNNFRGSPVKLTEVAVGIRYLPFSLKVGAINKFENNIASVSSRTSSRIGNRGEILTSGQGSEQNALRHTLLSAMLAQTLGRGGAEDIANAHEGILPGQNVTLEENEATPKGSTLTTSDNIADFFNNEIGRQLGEEMPDASPKTLAKQILSTFMTDGLFQVNEKDGNKVQRIKITEEQFFQAFDRLNELDENGRTRNEINDLQRHNNKSGIPN